jgi:hypothetical protein
MPDSCALRFCAISAAAGVIVACTPGLRGTQEPGPASSQVVEPARPALEEAGAADAAPALPGQEVEGLVQAVIDLGCLAPYWHADTNPERSPLVVVANERVPVDLHLTSFGQAVQVVAREELAGRPFLEITEADIPADRARAAFTYPVEGIAGSASFVRLEGRWTVERCDVSER